MPVTPPRAKAFVAAIALALFLLVAAACGAVEVTVERTTSTPAPDPTPTSAPADAPAPTAAPVDTPTPTQPPPAEPGSYEGVTYVVGEGSEATFTVEEKLSSLPLPNDAVVRTTALSGEVHFDGRPSVIDIQLHELESDQSRRDRYIRERMFPNDPIATFTLPDSRPLPARLLRRRGGLHRDNRSARNQRRPGPCHLPDRGPGRRRRGAHSRAHNLRLVRLRYDSPNRRELRPRHRRGRRRNSHLRPAIRRVTAFA